MAALANPQSDSPFNKVPLEVLLRISTLLNTTELGALRLTCRSIEQSLFNTFMKEFFTKRQFMITEFSLQALVDISNSRLSDCLDHVIIGLNCFTRQHFPPGKEACETRYREAQADHFALVNSGHHVVMLTEAFRNLKNLKTVGIRDYNSKARGLRDGFTATWASYGATTLEKETEVNLFRVPVDEIQAYTNKVFISVFTALGNAGARPKAFELFRKGQGVPSDEAFNLFTKYLEPKVTPVLQGLETFMCVVNVANGPFRTTAPVTDADDNTVFSRPSEAELQPPGNNSDAVDHFINWLGTPTPKPLSTSLVSNGSQLPPPSLLADESRLPPPPPPVAFPHVEELNLGLVDVEPRRLIQLIRKLSPTLKKLELWKLTLWNKAAETRVERRDHYKVNLWAKMLKALSDIPSLNLDHIMIGSPAQRTFMTNTKVWFHNGPDDKVDKKEYTGIDWKHFVEELAGQVKAELPVESDEDMDEYDSELDEEMEDDLMNIYYNDMNYYPDDMQEALEMWEDMMMHESGFH
ncbi:putative F-box domain-containing protein [Colletotrichum sublineola]|uniref:Putative F-box domain-containing protein n=1 Tax=Colletotrichum sublineola TaxID=1173701 RepID=A0A066XJH7_COLSU|nr:putative F-box domain-containing protein [Colletotrichum sublineola]